MRQMMMASMLFTAGLAAGAAQAQDQTVRVGLIQMNAKRYDKEFNMERAEALIREAASRGARIVCTPEAAVQGYPRVSLPEGKSPEDPDIAAEREKILAAAEPIPGNAAERFSRIARTLGIWIVFGMDENRNGKLHNVAVLMSPAGEILGRFSKVHLQNWMTASGVNHGDAFPVWDVTINGVQTKIGIEICYDIQHPESTRELALGGAEIVFNPYCTSDFSRPLLVHLYQTRALENCLYIVRVNFAAPRNSGTSAVIHFDGSTQDELDRAEGVLVADLNLTALRKSRVAWNQVYGLRYRHPPAYRRLSSH